MTIHFSDEGREILSKKTAQHIGERCVIEVDGRMMISAIIRSPIESDFRIALSSNDDVIKYSTLFKHGSLEKPITLTIEK